MDRLHDLLNNIQKEVIAAQTYNGKKRSDLKDSDFLFPETRSFPIVTPQDVPHAINNFGRMKGQMSYESFLRKLYNKIKDKPEFVAALPDASKEQLGLVKKDKTESTILPVPTVMVEKEIENPNSKPIRPELVDEQQVDETERLAKQKLENIRVTDNGLMDGMTSDNPVVANMNFKIGDMVKNVNAQCKHYGSMGPVTDIEKLPDDAGDLVVYRTVNAGANWTVGQTLKKTEVQLIKANFITKDNTMMQSMPNREPSNMLDQDYTSDVISEEMENESPETEMNEYKQEFMEMSIASLKAIAVHANSIVNHLDNPSVQENLTESWLQGKIAITEDYMRTIHDFIMFSESEADTTSDAGSKPGLWDNIRKKREREGKNYKPAKPGDKDRPDPEQWKKLTK